MVTTCHLTSMSFTPFTKPLGPAPRTPITIFITFTSMFHRFFTSLGRSRYLPIFSGFFYFPSVILCRHKVPYTAGFLSLFFFFCKLSKVWSSDRLAGIRGTVCISKSQKILCVSFSMMCFQLVHISQVRKVRFQFLSQFPVNYFSHPVVSSLILFLCKFVAFDYYYNYYCEIFTIILNFSEVLLTMSFHRSPGIF